MCQSSGPELLGTGDTTPGPARGWVEQITRHALRHGATLPLDLRRAEPGAAGAGTYTVASLGEAMPLRVSHPEAAPGRGAPDGDDAPWLLIGTTIEEVWT